jgi:galactarate dehydratase
MLPSLRGSFVTSNSNHLISLGAGDNVAVARFDIAQGQVLCNGAVEASQNIPRGHKVALVDIPIGTPVIKYGQPIGIASASILAGDHVHLHNLAMRANDAAHDFCSDYRSVEGVTSGERRQFLGFARPDGRVGTRNYIAIISSVNCSATVAKNIAQQFSRQSGLKGRLNVDGVVALTHDSGCAISQNSDAYRILKRTMQGYARNPNVGAVLMIGLGCEANQVHQLVDDHGLSESPTVRTMTIQKAGGTRKAIDAGCEAIEAMLEHVDAQRRTPQSLAHLTVGLQCGGSDGYSGISANPALGCAVDMLVRHGGTAVLSETPEIYGAEHLLTRRAASPSIAQQLVDRIQWWCAYTAHNGAEMNNNPAPGNKAGGLTTIVEKSLGAVAKGGSTSLNAVYEYAEAVTASGLVFMDTPGYDPVSVTGQVAGGCNLICFTTGRGSVSGFKPAPCIKIATNTEMYEHMQEDMDLNCGTVISGHQSLAESGRDIFERIVAVASGDQTKSEIFDYGDNEFVPWHIGATM